MSVTSVRPMTPVRPMARPAAQAAPAPAAPSGKAVAVAGAAVGGGVMTAAYTALRWFGPGQGGPVVWAVAAVGIGLAALGGAKIGRFVERGFKFQDFTVGGALGGAAALTAYAGGAALLASFGSMAAPTLLLLGAGSALAALGGAAIGHAAQDKLVALFKR